MYRHPELKMNRLKNSLRFYSVVKVDELKSFDLFFAVLEWHQTFTPIGIFLNPTSKYMHGIHMSSMFGDVPGLKHIRSAVTLIY